MTMHGADTFGATPKTRRRARVLIRTAVLALPSGAVRDRYRSEHLAELCALPGDHQIRYGLGALTSSWTLRRALIEEWDVTSAPSQFAKPMLCRLNLRHHWKWQYNPGGERYRRCTRCGKDDMGDPPRATKEHRLPPMPLG
jgi:hypothetical protein